MVGEAAGVGILFADFLARVGHQQTVQNVGRFVHRGRDGLGGEGTELVGDMGVGFQSGFMAVFGVDQIHRFALARGGEELPITGRAGATAPEPCHWQGGLAFDHHGQGARHRLAFYMPPRQARQLEIVVGVCGPGHFAEAEVQSFSQQYIQHADPVLAWDARAQMGEGLGKADLVIHFEQQVGDPDLWQAFVKIEHHGVGLFGNIGSQAVDLEHAVFD